MCRGFCVLAVVLIIVDVMMLVIIIVILITHSERVYMLHHVCVLVLQCIDDVYTKLREYGMCESGEEVEVTSCVRVCVSV